MKSQNSEIYLLCSCIHATAYWYGKLDCAKREYYWSKSAISVIDLVFDLASSKDHSNMTLEELALDSPIIHQQSTPFDLAYLQTHYPKLLI